MYLRIHSGHTHNLGKDECVANPWWDICSSKPDLCVLQALNSRGLALCDTVFCASDLIAVSLLATELGAGVTRPLWDACWDCVWWAGTSPEVEGEKGLPLWWCTHLCQHKCQVSPSCRANWAKCPCILEHFANAFLMCSSSMKLCASCEKTVWYAARLEEIAIRWQKALMLCPRFRKDILANCTVKRNSC